MDISTTHKQDCYQRSSLARTQMTMPATSTAPASGPNFCHPRRGRTRDVDEQASLFLRKAYHVVSNCPPHLGTIQHFSLLIFHPDLNESLIYLQGVGLQAVRHLLWKMQKLSPKKWFQRSTSTTTSQASSANWISVRYDTVNLFLEALLSW